MATWKNIPGVEVWKDIRGYEGLYEVSDLGNVRSQDRRVVNHKSGSTRICSGMPIIAWDNGNGYLVVTLCKQRKKKNYYVHRLVAMAFLGNPESKQYVNHIDYNTHNNKASNLEWCTQRENVMHSAPNMRHPKSNSKPSNTGEKYISKRTYHSKCVRYVVNLEKIGIYKSFKALEEAVEYRNRVLKGVV